MLDLDALEREAEAVPSNLGIRYPWFSKNTVLSLISELRTARAAGETARRESMQNSDDYFSANRLAQKAEAELVALKSASKWLVAVDMSYYPYMNEYNTYEEAKADYDKYGDHPVDDVYLAEVKEHKS
jgi:hypothetical protein